MTITQVFVASLLIILIILSAIAYQGMCRYPSTKLPYSIWYSAGDKWHEYVLKK